MLFHLVHGSQESIGDFAEILVVSHHVRASIGPSVFSPSSMNSKDSDLRCFVRLESRIVFWDEGLSFSYLAMLGTFVVVDNMLNTVKGPNILGRQKAFQ